MEAVRVISNNIFTKRPPKKANERPIIYYYKKNTSIKLEIRSRKVSIVILVTTRKSLLKIVFGIFI